MGANGDEVSNKRQSSHAKAQEWDRLRHGLVTVGMSSTHAIMSSVIRCELSMRPRSANSESAAEDLYALCGVYQLPDTEVTDAGV